MTSFPSTTVPTCSRLNAKKKKKGRRNDLLPFNTSPNVLKASAKKCQMGGGGNVAPIGPGQLRVGLTLSSLTRAALARLPKQLPGLTTGEEKEKWKTRQSTRTDRLMVGKPTGSFFSEILFF